MTNKNGADETLSSFTYTYAADGNILTEVANTGTTETTTYTYDLLGRLIAEVGNAGTRFYTYDTAGNRTKVIIDTTTTIDYNYNSDGELISESSNNGTVRQNHEYTYDANGNLITKTEGISTTNYAYDVWGNMVSADNATYAYNAQGLRVSKSVGNATTNFLLVGGNVWSDGTTNYTRGIELISNGTQLYLYNVRGDVIQLLGFDGEVDKTYDYDAYGNEYARDLGDSNPFRYCGEYYDTETGFIYLRARYYDPATGRFVAMDTHWNPSNAIYGDNPVKTSSAEDCKSLYPNINAIIQSTNLYVYCGNNPIAYKDNTGKWMYPGYFHNMVVKEVANKYSLSPERWISYGPNVGLGRADLVDLKTGEVWEVKPVKLVDVGVLQLELYVSNRLVSDPKLDLRRGDARISTGQIDAGEYTVKYWYARSGVIAYVPVKKLEKVKVLDTNKQVVLNSIAAMLALGLTALVCKTLKLDDGLETQEAW